jgi:hypothetical protein
MAKVEYMKQSYYRAYWAHALWVTKEHGAALPPGPGTQRPQLWPASSQQRETEPDDSDSIPVDARATVS